MESMEQHADCQIGIHFIQKSGHHSYGGMMDSCHPQDLFLFGMDRDSYIGIFHPLCKHGLYLLFHRVHGEV